MQSLKAVVRNGRFVVDEPTELPEGTEVELQLTKVASPWADLTAEERTELEAEIEEGAADFQRGDHMDARAFLDQLRAKRP
jgi:hypothetical protein